jgi:hypothetical protein
MLAAALGCRINSNSLFASFIRVCGTNHFSLFFPMLILMALLHPDGYYSTAKSKPENDPQYHHRPGK